ncbi:YbfB/YjiJ family MFS transporter [Vibrio sp. HN007]|uniref:YbfB/YjiJ family MFS transporter n=1 Tax=Vibrio iocasae TaxID=3098914 RepID=UPI0035D4763E
MNSKDIRLLLFGVSTTFIGLGIGRFAFASIMPELVLSGWFSDVDASYIGTANLLGYLVGALSAGKLLGLLSAKKILLSSILGITLSYFVCMYPGNLYWFLLWRFVAGVSGALLMVLGPSISLSQLSKSSQAIGGNLIFTGLGLGILLSTAIAPITGFFGLSMSWMFLGVVALLFVPFVLHTINHNEAELKREPQKTKKNRINIFSHKSVLFVILAYAMQAIGYVPHTVFWVDYLAREQELGTYVASIQWMFFGIGAILGPLLLGVVTHHLGWSKALLIAFIIKTIGIALPVFSSSFVSYTLSSFLVGAMLPSIVALVSGTLYTLVGAELHKQFWGVATFVFAALQAVSGYTMSLWYSTHGSYESLFAIATLCLTTGSLFAAMSLLGKKECIREEETST